MPYPTVKCPNCGKPVVLDPEKSPWRPFCSKECKMIDLGDWASNRFVIEGRPATDEELASAVRNSSKR